MIDQETVESLIGYWYYIEASYVGVMGAHRWKPYREWLELDGIGWKRMCVRLLIFHRARRNVGRQPVLSTPVYVKVHTFVHSGMHKSARKVHEKR